MKKGQMVASQVFIYILGAAVIILIMLFGYKAISGFKDQSDQVAIVNFKTEMISTTGKISGEWGTSVEKSFVVPSKFDTVCFVDTTEATRPNPRPQNLNPIIYNYWKGNSKENVFLVGGDTVEPLFVGPKDTEKSYFKVSATNNYFCQKVVAGRITVRIDGDGQLASISPP